MAKSLLVDMLFYGNNTGYLLKNYKKDGSTSYTFKFNIIGSSNNPRQKTFRDKGSAMSYAKSWGFKPLKNGVYPIN